MNASQGHRVFFTLADCLKKENIVFNISGCYQGQKSTKKLGHCFRGKFIEKKKKIDILLYCHPWWNICMVI